LAAIAPAIESAHRESKTVVGFYRSRTRGDGVLRPSDRVILEAIEKAHGSFPQDFRCCVVLAPKTLTLSEVSVALRVGSGWIEVRPITLQSNAFPGLGESASSALEPFARAEKPAAVPPLPVTRPRVHENRASRVSPPQLISKEAIWRYAAVALFAAGVMWVVTAHPWTWGNPKELANAPVMHLGFSVTREGPRWKLTWSPAAV